MSASKKLSLAVKALYVLDQYDGQPLSSNQIAKELGVNSSKLRRLLSMLVKSHLIESIQGTSGGFVLKRKPEQIDLQEIYCSVEEKKAFYLDVHEHIGIGSSSARMNDYFLDLFADVQVVIEDKMRQISLDDVIKKVNT
ncbi:MAG: Rrf2 family transcriptional regulator [Calditrichaeota bacterium]|nr:Rrf2 family transcriptional regulator [Calditrichota bacterium]